MYLAILCKNIDYFIFNNRYMLSIVISDDELYDFV